MSSVPSEPHDVFSGQNEVFDISQKELAITYLAGFKFKHGNRVFPAVFLYLADSSREDVFYNCFVDSPEKVRATMTNMGNQVILDDLNFYKELITSSPTVLKVQGPGRVFLLEHCAYQNEPIVSDWISFRGPLLKTQIRGPNNAILTACFCVVHEKVFDTHKFADLNFKPEEAPR